MILYSPAEPRTVVNALTRIATERDIEVAASSRTERMGVDFAWRDRGGTWAGLQRKELHDFLASLDDGRLAKEVGQMRAALTMPTLALEGKMLVANGYVTTSGYGRPVTLSSLFKQLRTIQSRDILTFQTSDAHQTAQLVVDLYEWHQAEHHGTAGTRPKPAGDWGKPTNRDFQVHLLTALPGVGERTAANILDTFGRCPLRLDVTVKELVQVPGVGPVLARRIVEAVGSERESTA